MPRRPLPSPEVAVVNPDSGLITRDWYDYFIELGRPSVTTLPYGTTIATDARSGENFTITATNGTGFTISAPTNPVTGQVITYTIRNTSGGALGAITWNSVFKMAAFTAPATTNSRSISFVYNGTNWVERFRSASDIPN